MADVTVEVIGNSKFATVGYSRKVNKEVRGGHKYESEEFSLYAPFDISDVKDNTDLTQRIEAASTAVKANVLNQLAIPFVISDDGVVEETLDVDAVAAAFKAPVLTSVPTGSAPAKVRPVEGFEPCPKCGETKRWDNRAEKASGKRGERFPDERCSGKLADGKPCGKGFWDTPRAT